MKKSEHPQDIRIQVYEDLVVCSCRYKNRNISVTYIKEQNVFQTNIKGYFGNTKGSFYGTFTNRGIKSITYNLSKELLTCLTAIQTELLQYLHKETNYLK